MIEVEIIDDDDIVEEPENVVICLPETVGSSIQDTRVVIESTYRCCTLRIIDDDSKIMIKNSSKLFYH